MTAAANSRGSSQRVEWKLYPRNSRTECTGSPYFSFTCCAKIQTVQHRKTARDTIVELAHGIDIVVCMKKQVQYRHSLSALHQYCLVGQFSFALHLRVVRHPHLAHNVRRIELVGINLRVERRYTNQCTDDPHNILTHAMVNSASVSLPSAQ